MAPKYRNPDPTYNGPAIRAAGKRMAPAHVAQAKKIAERFHENGLLGKGVTKKKSEEILANLPNSNFKIPDELKKK